MFTWFSHEKIPPFRSRTCHRLPYLIKYPYIVHGILP
jgi:hypothetical protein